MATTDYLLVRIVPTKPVGPTAFRQALDNLTITAYDKMVLDPTQDRTLGSATGLSDKPQPGSGSGSGSGSGGGSGTTPPPNVTPLVISGNPPTLTPSIIQHFGVDTKQNVIDMYSVATAVIIINQAALQDPTEEYPTSKSYDVKLKLEQTGTTQTAASRQQIVDFNATIMSLPLTTDPIQYMGANTDVYLSIDVPALPLPSGTKIVSLNSDGTPPSFDFMVSSIDAVLALDAPAGASSLEQMSTFLSPAQAKQVASELVNNRSLDPPPPAPYATSTVFNGGTVFEDMYTIPDSGGTVKQDIDQARTKFEGDRSSYYALRTSDAIQFANFVYSTVFAVYAENYTATAPRAVVDVPIQTIMQHTASISTPSLALSGGANNTALSPAFTVPAAYFYALTTTYAITQDFDTRLKLLLTTTETALTNSLQLVIGQGVLGSPSTTDKLIYYSTTLQSSNSININQLQAIRRILALQASVQNAPVASAVPAANSNIQTLITSWLKFAGADADVPAQVWFPPATEYLNAVLEIIAPGNEALISELVADLRLPPTGGAALGPVIQSVSDLLHVTENQWLEFFTRHPDLLPKAYLLGTLKERVHSFVQDITKVLFVLPAAQAAALTSTGTSVPSLSADLSNDVLVQFFNSSSFLLTDTLDAAEVEQLHTLALQLFDSEQIAAFVTAAVQELWVLYQSTLVKDTINANNPISNSLQFSYMEALHARGFTTPESMQALSEAQFASALSGTVAFPRANDIYDLASKLPSDFGGAGTEPGSGFQPVNHGGLTNCEPPCHVSPFGAVQYLSDLINFTPGAPGSDTLGTILATRRGSFANLSVTDANLNDRLPVIDIINENLEALAGNLTTFQGATFNTNVTGLSELDISGEPEISIPHELTESDILAALPQHSSPHLPLNQSTLYDTLKSSLLGPNLPYSQPLDISRTYLAELDTTRFDIMRIFLRDITEFALDASKEPDQFQRNLWRLPVRYEIALEYLGISADEASLLFSGSLTTSLALQLLGQSPDKRGNLSTILQVPVFMTTMGLTYCEFLELQRSGIVAFGPPSGDGEVTSYPECLPCCAENVTMSFPGEGTAAATGLIQLAIFIRLWRSINRGGHCSGPHSLPMKLLVDICDVLQLFSQQNVNPDFLRQLASLLMLKEIWDPPWTSHDLADPSSSEPDQRSMLLAIWSGKGTDDVGFRWAVKEILKSIEKFAIRRHQCERSASWHKLLPADLDKLAELCGFIQDTWYSKPTCTIRFVELLTKIYASPFTVGEVLFLFTAKKHLRDDDPFQLTEEDESKDDPLNVPEDDEKYGLWRLRRKLLDVEACDDELADWPWPRIEATIKEMGYHEHGEQFSLSYFAEHFFPETLEASGHHVSVSDRRFTTSIPKSSSPHIWHPLNKCSPFSYEAPQSQDSEEATGSLWTTLPVCDETVLETLRDIRQLNGAEAAAVRALYLLPRTALAPFALLFTNFEHAARVLIHEPCEKHRFAYFQKEFIAFHKKCKVTAHHIHDAVVASEAIDSAECHCAKGDCDECDGAKAAWRVLRGLIADENSSHTAWEDAADAGTMPTAFTWDANFSGNAFAALLGLGGIGAYGVYSAKTPPQTAWEEIRGPLAGWGSTCNWWDVPVPTVLPSMTVIPSSAQADIASFKNGFALNQATGRALIGTEPFKVTWRGLLLIDQPGCYHFAFTCPFHNSKGEDKEAHCRCDADCERLKRWKVTLNRGQKHWDVLERGTENQHHNRNSIPEVYSKQMPLRHGAYDIEVEFEQLEPSFTNPDSLSEIHTGFKVSFQGPDTRNCLHEIPLSALYLQSKDGPLFQGGEVIPNTVQQVINLRYIPTIRDIRRTYQRAFKAVLFTHRFRLSACLDGCLGESELGYLLDNPTMFQGTSYYWDASSTTFKVHHADFDFNFLPVTDEYYPPTLQQDDRVGPSPKRQNAMFDWFERIFDYTVLREDVRRICDPPVWFLCYHAVEDSPQPVAQLLRRVGVEIHLAPLVLEYFATTGMFDITDTNNISMLADERWLTRIWKAREWLVHITTSFYSPSSELVLCRPALWAATPQPDITVAGTTTTGNLNLTFFVQRSCMTKNKAALRAKDVVRLNDGLRDRARNAILEYLAANGQSVDQVSDYLLLDVCAPVKDKTTRIDDAVAATQRLMQRAILGLEPQLTPSGKAIKTWQCKLASFDKWLAAQKKKWYPENWLQWDEISRLRKNEGFATLDKSLKAGITSTVSIARDITWDSPPNLPQEPREDPLSWSQAFVLGTQTQALNEGLQLMGTPDNSGTPTWLAALTPTSGASVPNPEGGGGSGSSREGRSSSEHVPNGQIKKVTDSAAILTPTTSASTPQLPGASSITSIPLWLQSTLRLGVRFIRVAASSLPIAAPYRDGSSKSKTTMCCQCRTKHAPVIDEYYFWLQDAKRFDAKDPPIPQDADSHNNVPGVNQSVDPNNPQIDPRTIQADPTSDWDAPTPQMLYWKPEPKVYLYWARVHRGVLQDQRRSTEGIPLVDTDLGSLYLDLQGRQFDSLTFTIKQGDNTIGFRYDIAADAAVALPEAVASSAPAALPVPSALAANLAAFPYFLYFDGGVPLVPVHTFGTSLVIASSLRADCDYKAALDWLKVAYDPLSRTNTWMQCLQSRSDSLVDHSIADSGNQAVPEVSTSTDLFSSSSTLIHVIPAMGTDMVRLSDNDETEPKNAAAETPVVHGTDSKRNPPPADGTCCPTVPVAGGVSRGRAVVLEYIETLLAWAEATRCRNSLETDQQALTLLTIAERVVGPTPKDVAAVDLTGGQMTVGTFHAYPPPVNPRLIRLYGTLTDRMRLVRDGINCKRQRNGVLQKDWAAWGAHRRFDVDPTQMIRYQPVPDECYEACVYSCSQTYRFSSVLPKANQWIAMVKSTGASLLSALEKADTEALAALKCAQERQVTELGLEITQNQCRAADWDVQALDVQINNAIARLQYYQALIQNGLNPNENGYIFATGASMASRTSATVVDGIAQGMASVPDMWVGVAGAYGSPLQFQQMPMGVKMGTGFATAARILNTVADISSSTAGLSSTQGGWDRRTQDWQHQCDVTVYEIQQIKRQRLAARRRLEVSKKELNNTQRRIENEAEVQDFMRDKFTKYELYLWLRQENAALYREMFTGALQVAVEAQQAARYELGDESLAHVPTASSAWDHLHAGLLAGEELEHGVAALERAYMNKNCREYELVKHVSLRLHFPASFVLLKATGYCEVELPEWFFDLDYPGHYMRRIRSVSLTIPCVAGPYTGIHCKLQQLDSSIRLRPWLGRCNDCCHCQSKAAGPTTQPSPSNSDTRRVAVRKQTTGKPCIRDPNLVTRYAGTEAIATSLGQNDAGLFEVSFNDPRYLPFEYSGAVSRWRIELPPENNQFNFDSLSDLIMHINFTAREGGPDFKRACHESAQERLPADGLRFIDVRHELPEAWAVLRRNETCHVCRERQPRSRCCDEDHCDCKKHSPGRHENKCGGHDQKKGTRCTKDCQADCSCAQEHFGRTFHLQMSRQMFPFFNRCGRIALRSIHILLELDRCEEQDCFGTFYMRFRPTGECAETERLHFVRSTAGIWSGTVEFDHAVSVVNSDQGKSFTRGATWKTDLGTFSLPCDVKNVTAAWLLCKYDVEGGNLNF